MRKTAFRQGIELVEQSGNPLLDLLKLSTAQLQLGLKESEEPVERLTHSFTQLAELIQTLTHEPTDSATKDQLIQQLQSQIQQSITAFQFYDRLVQQLQHVTHHLQETTDLLADSHESMELRLKQKLQAIGNEYSMESEREIYRLILAGRSVATALSEYQDKKTSNHNEIELF